MTYSILEVHGGMFSEFIEADISSLALELKAQNQKFQFLHVLDYKALCQWNVYYNRTAHLPLPSSDQSPFFAYSQLHDCMMFSDPQQEMGLYRVYDNEVIYCPRQCSLKAQRDSIDFIEPIKYLTCQSLDDTLKEFAKKNFSFFQSDSTNSSKKQAEISVNKKPLRLNY